MPVAPSRTDARQAASTAPAPASTQVSLSPEGMELASSTSPADALPLPDLDGIGKIDEALAGVPDTSAAQARDQAQLAREKDKLKNKISMLDLDAFRLLRDKLRNALQGRPAPSAEQQKQDEADARRRVEDNKPLD